LRIPRESWRPVAVLYYDHHDEHGLDNAGMDSADLEAPPCYLILQVGVVVYEDADWLRLCHEIDDTAGDERYWCTAIRKGDIVKRVEL
jgi:hypothetical protein